MLNAALKMALACSAIAMSQVSAANDAATVERLILEQEDAWGRALMAHDAEGLSRLMAEDWTNQNESGYLVSKATLLNDVRAGKIVLKTFKLHDLHVRVLGDIVVVQGSDDEESSYGGANTSGTYNWLDVWHKVGDRWVSVCTQLTRISNPSSGSK